MSSPTPTTTNIAVTPITNTGNAQVFFDVVAQSQTADDLISGQLDPSGPQLTGLDSVTSPLVPDRHINDRVSNFDPTQFDLTSDSHLMRLLTALLGAGGAGGLRRLMTIARMSGALSGTNWLELDGFWGYLFSIPRDPASEAFPVNSDGTPFLPASQVADSDMWDAVASRDGRYRSRIEQLAKGFANGATFTGFRYACQALFNADVEIVESWTIADSVTAGTTAFQGVTWFVVEHEFPTYGAMDGITYSLLSGALPNPGSTPIGNRGEIIVIPGRSITEAERWVASHVLNALAPAGTIVTVVAQGFTATQSVTARDVEADSNDWQIVSLVSQQQALSIGSLDLYPDTDDTSVESARPGLASYSGEHWSYNGQISSVTSYALAVDGSVLADPDYGTITFSDGSQYNYVASDAVTDPRRMAMARAAADGVLTTYPYVPDRSS